MGKTRTATVARLGRWLVASVVCGGWGLASWAEAQPPQVERDEGLPLPLPPAARARPLVVEGLDDSAVQPALPRMPLARPRPLQGPESVESFIESLKGNDAAFEVIVGQGRILSTQEDLIEGPRQALIAVGDPSVIDFTVVNERQIRVMGLRVGVTDLLITTAAGESYSFEVRVVADLRLLEGQLRAKFPDASLRLGQIRDHIVVEGEARDTNQVSQILQTIQAYLESVRVGQERRIRGQQAGAPGAGMLPAGAAMPGEQVTPPVEPGMPEMFPPAALPMMPGFVSPEQAAALQIQGAIAMSQIINLIRVPGSQQVMLKVRIAELNRTALRNIGSNFLGVDPGTGAIVGSQIAGPVGAIASVPFGARNLFGEALGSALPLGVRGGTTVFGIFQDANFEFMLNALRRNAFLRILAEPNLIAMSGHQANFLAGGEFPVPVPQVGVSGIAPTITVQFKEFGVRLGFVPYILDSEIIRLNVVPEVSRIDFSIATTLVAGGTPVPGLNTRRAETTVELREGQTLAIAGLLELDIDGTTERIPGLGDLPILGPFFSNTTGQRVEKELVVLVTPFLVEAMHPDQVPPTPGDEVKEPNDLEFYLLNRIESRVGRDFRSTTAWDDPWHLVPLLKLEKKYVHGPVGFSD